MTTHLLYAPDGNTTWTLIRIEDQAIARAMYDEVNDLFVNERRFVHSLDIACRGPCTQFVFYDLFGETLLVVEREEP